MIFFYAGLFLSGNDTLFRWHFVLMVGNFQSGDYKFFWCGFRWSGLSGFLVGLHLFHQTLEFFGWKLFLFRSYVNVNFFHSKGFSEFEKFALHDESFDLWLTDYKISWLMILYNSVFYFSLSLGFKPWFMWLTIFLIWFWMLWFVRLSSQNGVFEPAVLLPVMQTVSFPRSW